MYGQLHDKVVLVSVVLPAADYIHGVRGSPFEPSSANLSITFYVTASLNLSTHGNSTSSAHSDPYSLGNSYVDCFLRSQLSLSSLSYWDNLHFI
jgi:hypothetical protein